MRTRKQSESGFYHVIASADGHQSLFETEQEHLQFLQSLIKARDKYDLAVHVWCLMKTHAHLIIEDPHRRLGEALRDAFSRYAKTLNYLRNDKGVVFHPRYWSEPIETDSYLLAAMHYIHNNPQAAGICPAKKYRWSSYHAYAQGTASNPLTQTRKLLAMVGGSDGFTLLHAQPPTAKPFPESNLRDHLNDQEVQTIAADVLKISSPSDSGKIETKSAPTPSTLSRRLQAMLATSGAKRQSELVRLLHQQGFTLKQIQRLTGFTYRHVQRIVKSDDGAESPSEH